MITSSGPRHRQRKPARLPQFPPDNELPVPLSAGPFLWRSPDAGITAAGFLAYSTGITFRIVVLSKRTSLMQEEPREDEFAEPSRVDLGDGSLKFGAQGVPIIFHSWSRNRHRMEIDAWVPFQPQGEDLVFYLEWPTEGIDYSEFRIPRSSAEEAIVLWPQELPKQPSQQSSADDHVALPLAPN